MRACARASLLWLVRHPVLSLGLLLVWACESGAPATDALPPAALTIHRATLYGGIGLLVIALAIVSIRRFGDDLADAITVAMDRPDTAMAIVAIQSFCAEGPNGACVWTLTLTLADRF